MYCIVIQACGLIFYTSSISSISVRSPTLVVITTLHIQMFSFFQFFLFNCGIVVVAFGCLSNNVGFYNQRAASHFHELLNTLYFICMIFVFVYFVGD